ncbi:hypothetical protein [Paraburkholderia sp. J63]|uniref:prenyltransferase/squalene oxidase repeat-containing protein n=1 Tax=Paraburkholderia sp. J63 TaxID=2805434 RepID=UPI002ABD4877|nr:hypothetical protein [Paraburkholderia sp. J63]
MSSSTENLSEARREKLHREVGEARAKAHEYLCGRQSRSGGFCFYRSQHTDHPNIEDTGCAVRSFVLLGLPIPDAEHVKAFLASLGTPSQPRFLFHLVTAFHALEVESLPDTVARSVSRLGFAAVPDRQFQQTGWLERTRCLAHLKVMLDDRSDVSAIAKYMRTLAVAGGFGATPNIWDTWLALDILRLAEDISIPDDTARFVDSLQCKPSGFTLSPETRMSRLDPVFSGVQCCQLLDLPIRYPLESLEFVLACQVGSGGFAASPGALPDLALTERALWTIGRLCNALWPERE